MSSSILLKTGIEEIHFGNGGGFTGIVMTYKITANSTLFANEKEIKKIDKKKTLELFRTAEELKDFCFNETENIYSFIELKTTEKTNRIVWGTGNEKMNQKVIDFYKKLVETIK